MYYKMQPKEYFRKLVELYVNSREPCYYNPNIFRGRSSAISSDLEDLTALFIALNNSIPCPYYTDQPMRFVGLPNKYPDIVIQNESDGVIRNLVDVKADIGWNRNGMYDFCQEWEGWIASVEGKATSFVEGKSKIRRHGQFAGDLKYHVLITTLVNSGTKILEDYRRVERECSRVKLYILSDGIHPNSYGMSQDDILGNIHINGGEFERFFGYLGSGVGRQASEANSGEPYASRKTQSSEDGFGSCNQPI